MADTDVRRATPADAAVVGRLLHDFNTEFDTETPSADEFASRFSRLLARDDVIVLLSGDEEHVSTVQPLYSVVAATPRAAF